MSPERDWHYPKADMYLLYSLKQAPPYNCSAPFWREAREEIFTELRNRCMEGRYDVPTIYYLALVKHNENSIALPIGDESPSYYGFYFLEGKEADIINTKNETPYSYVSACKDLAVSHPHLIKWFDRDKRWHKVTDYHYYQAGNKFYSTIIPRDNTTYFHVEYRDD